MIAQSHKPSNASVNLLLPGNIAVTDNIEIILDLKFNFSCQIVSIDHNFNQNLKKLFTKCLNQINNSTKKLSLKSPKNDSKTGAILEQFYEDLYSKKNLPKQVRQLEKISRYYCYLWLAWYYYSKQKYSLMTQYLWESWQYTDAPSSKTINHWYDFLGEDLNQGNNLSSIAQWQQLIEKTREIDPPKVSVIIPSYNCDQYLPEAIESVLNQTYQDYEIIVINDGSTDLTLEVIAPYLEQIRYVYQENQGVSAARNRGLYLARGELIAFLDADDLFLPHKLKEQVAIFEERGEIGIVNSGFRVIRENGEPIMDVERWQEIPDLTPEVWLLYKPILPSAMMFRRQWFELVGGFDSRFFSSEDVEVTLRMVVKGCKGVWLPKITIYYRRHENSVTWKNTLKQARNSEAMQDDFFAREDLPTSMRQLEGKSRFYYYCWLGWLCYQSSLYDQMSQYLLKSQSHGTHSWVETVCEWLNTFSNCAKIYGCDFDAYTLSNLSQWQGTLAQIQSSALERNFQPQINQVQQLFHPVINDHHTAVYGQTYYQLARKLIQQHDLEQAIISLRRAIELVPHNAFYHHALSTAYQQQYDLDRALLSYQRAVGLQPNQNDFQTSLQSVLQQQRTEDTKMKNKLALAANSSTAIVIPKDIEIGSTQEFHGISCCSAGLTYQIIAIAQNIADIDLDRNIKKIFEQYFSLEGKSSNSVESGDCKSLHNLEQFYEDLYSKKNLPKQVRQLEKISRYYCYLWLAWYYYSKQKYSLMTQYLWESWQYTDAPSSKTINHWYDFLGEDLNQGNNLSSIAQWQQLIEKTREIDPPKVSVIIPSYNCDQYLPEAIESVLNQTYQDYEIIVINDGSTDLTLEVIAPYLEQIRYVYQENQGAGEARNRGLYLARGELIAFLDADDLFLPHKLKEQVAIFEERGEIGIVNSGFRVIRENGEPIMDVERWQEIPDLTPEVWLLYKPVLPSAMMFRRQWFELVGGFRQCFFPCEDMEIILRMVAKGCQSVWLASITACYRRYNLSATALNSSRILKLAQSAEAMQDDFFAREDLPTSMRQLEGKSRFYYYCWLGWLCYQSSLYDQMSQYLLKSQSHGTHSWVETVCEWLNTFSNCAKIYGCDFDAYTLSNLSQWQGTLAQIQSSALEKNFQPQINQVQQLFHPVIDDHHTAVYGQTYYQLARKLIQQHDLEQAIISLRRAIELVPHNAFYHHALGTAYQQQYDLDRALLSYQRAVGLQPNQNDFQTSLQSVLQQQQQWQKLVDYCQQNISTPGKESPQKLLMIFPFTPDPQQKGGAAIRMFEQIKYFGRRYQLTVVAFIFDESDKQLAEQLEQYCDLALLLEVGTPMSPYHQYQHQQLYFLQTWNMWKSLEQLSQIDFDLVFFEFIFATVYYPLFSDRLSVLNEHNIESKLLQSCAQTNSQELIRRLAKRVDAVKPFVDAKTEAQRLAAYEERMWSLLPLITVVSEEDKQELETRCPSAGQGGKTRTLVVKNGVNTQEILPVDNQQGQKILFMGTMSYFPNIDGVLYFVEEILPWISQQEPKIGFCIAGRKPPEEIWTLEGENAAIEVIADPPDMREVAAQCQMTVVPLRIGGGTRIKILHSMAMGLPVVSTSLGSEGLEVVDGEHLLIRDHPEQFAAAVLEIAGDSQLREKLRRNARRLVEAQYDWQAIFARFERSLLRFGSEIN